MTMLATYCLLKNSGVIVKAEKTELLTFGKKSNACREAAIGKTLEVLKAC